MKYSTLILITFMLFTCGKKTTEIYQQEPDIVINEESDQGDFTSFYNRFNIENNKFYGKDSTVSTFHQNGELKSLSHFAIDNDGEVSRFRTGEYKVYDNTKNIMSFGNYDLGKYTQCCAGGPCTQFYNYKHGIWFYYYLSGEIRAEVEYDVIKFSISTSCKGGDEIDFGKINISKSKFYDIHGALIIPSQELIDDFETVRFGGNGVFETMMFIKGGEIEWDWIEI